MRIIRAEELRGLLPNANFYPAPTSQVVVPAVVVRPDQPWIEADAMGWNRERYVAVFVVSAGDVPSGQATLYDMALTLMNVLPEGWSWHELGAMVVDESTGTPFLAASLRLSYRKAGV